MSANAIPHGYASVTPYLIIRGATQAIEFYQRVFGASERLRIPAPEGKIGHAEIEIGGSVVMLADEVPEGGVKSPEAFGGTPVSLLVYVSDSDAVFAKAIAAGAKPLRPVENQFYGDRTGAFSDPFGHTWHVSTHVEDVSPEELEKRMAAARKPR